MMNFYMRGQKGIFQQPWKGKGGGKVVMAFEDEMTTPTDAHEEAGTTNFGGQEGSGVWGLQLDEQLQEKLEAP